MSSPPTIYFPRNVRFRRPYKPGRQWATEVLTNPITGRQQVRQLWVRPKRRITAQIWPALDVGVIVNAGDFGNNDPGFGGPELTNDMMYAIQIQHFFLDEIKGRFNPFYIFDAAPRAFYQFLVGGWNGSGLPLPVQWPDDLPYTLPFKGTSLGLANPGVVSVVGVSLSPVGGGPALNYFAGDLSLDASGTGGETRLVNIIPTISPDPPPSSGPYTMRVNLHAAHERVPVRMTSDLDDLLYDFNYAFPDKEVAFDCEEYFG